VPSATRDVQASRTTNAPASPAATASIVTAAAPVAVATVAPASSGAPRPAAPATAVVPAPRTYSAQEGQAQVDAATLTPADLGATWVLQSDSAMQNNPDAPACGALATRTATNLAGDPVAAFVAGETLSFFSTATSYSTEAGAIECAARAATRLRTPGDLARLFGSLFIDPDAVTVGPADFPQVGDASIAATLTGKINASGTVIDITLLVVTYRKGNVLGAVGSARSGSVPPVAELSSLAQLVAGRIALNR
jgi:hypothetical protein